jgi:hypothetical protein
MAIKNLGSLVSDLQLQINQLEFKDIKLPIIFKRKYSEYLTQNTPGGYKYISWADHTFRITTSTDKSIFGSNYWFYLASKLAFLIGALSDHKEIFNNIFGSGNTSEDLERIAKELKTSATISSSYSTAISNYFSSNHLSSEEQSNFEQFVGNYPAWGGGKTIDRADYFASPVLKSGNLLAETQNAIAELAHQLFNNKDIWQDLRDEVEIINPLQNQQRDAIPSEAHLEFLSIPKPFLLLAGISGTGKTRFVREQAEKHGTYPKNHCLIAVRPDWHEPSDLLGYVSRMGVAHYVVTELLCFVVAAWKEAVASATADGVQNKAPADMTPYWLCLDEMNLAPVEQYFADYLAVLETRSWNGDVYSCAPLLKADAFNKLPDNAAKMREDLKLAGSEYDGLWAYFMKTGISLPPNLIVAGTVNMDETTHGFSRKVIDRAFTIDFGAFYPNDFDHYFEPQTKAKTLGFPCLSAVSKADLAQVTIDSNGQKSIAFLNAINDLLKNTPFELAFRALNELLISLVCFNPKDDGELQAVWDDFLMTKVLPRIDGDSHKLNVTAEESLEGSLLTKLAAVAALQCSAIWTNDRPDLLRENVDATLPCTVPCRSKAKLAWMQKRLESNGFTSFWP